MPQLGAYVYSVKTTHHRTVIVDIIVKANQTTIESISGVCLTVDGVAVQDMKWGHTKKGFPTLFTITIKDIEFAVPTTDYKYTYSTVASLWIQNCWGNQDERNNGNFTERCCLTPKLRAAVTAVIIAL